MIAAYARMERALAAYGLPRSPAEAPDEYLQRIFADLDVSRRATSRLTALFSWAKFSGHDVAPEMKQEAIEALEAVRDGVAGGRDPGASTGAWPPSPSCASGQGADATRPAGGRAAAAADDRARVALAVAPDRAALEVHVWLLVVLGLALLAFIGIVRADVPAHAFALRREPPATAAPASSAPQRSCASSARSRWHGSSAFDVHFRLRPTLVALAAELLVVARAASTSSRSPERAHAVLGDDVWELVAPDRPQPPQDAHGAGIGEARARSRRHGAGARLMELRELAELGGRLVDEVERAVVGKREQLELVLLGMLADGHVLLEDVPGLAKTLTARSFAEASGLGFSRVQFTPDLLPADVTGSSIWNQRDGDFEFRSGPDLHAPAARRRDQPRSAEDAGRAARGDAGATGDDGRRHPAAASGRSSSWRRRTRSSTKARTRCRRRSSTGSCSARGSAIPAADAEWEMLARRIERREDDVTLSQVIDRETLLEMQAAVELVHVEPSVGRYIVDVVAATRESTSLAVGASPRGSLALLKLSRCRAALAGRDFVTPDDVKAVAVPALAHRLLLKPELWVQRRSGEDVVRETLEAVPTPPAEDVAPPRVTPFASPRLASYLGLAALGLIAALALRRRRARRRRGSVRADRRGRAAPRGAPRM